MGSGQLDEDVGGGGFGEVPFASCSALVVVAFSGVDRDGLRFADRLRLTE